MHKLAIIVSHPIQYYSPLFAQLSKSGKIVIKVFYTWNPNETNAYDHGFKRSINWDIPLLEDYEYSFVPNTSNDPGTHHYYGLDNPGLINEIEKWDPDAILIYGWKYKSHLQVLKYFNNRIPIFFRGDSHSLDNLNFIRQTARRIILNWVFKKIDYAFYVGKNNREYFLEVGLNENQLIWAPHSVDSYRFNSDDEKREYEAKVWRQVLLIPEEAVVILFAGKLEAKKQPLLLLNIAKQLQDSNIYFIFIGNGIYETEIINASEIFQNIKYLPFQNQSIMPVVYRLGDIFCLPSLKEESWGLAVNEAMACGRPIIASNKVGCVDDLVIHGVNGFVFDVKRPDDLNAIIKLIAVKKSELKLMGNKSSEIISNWSIERQVEIIEKSIIDKLALPYEHESISVVE